MTKRFSFRFSAMRNCFLGLALAACPFAFGCKEKAEKSKAPDPKTGAAEATKPEVPPERDPRAQPGAERPEAKPSETKGTEANTPKGEAKLPPEEGGSHLGKAFASETITDIDSIVKDPKAFEGKTVRIQGVVPTHCHHKRAWFALQSAAGSPGAVRVMTSPGFLVPKDVKNGVTRASAEGLVEVRTVKEGFAKHLAKEHGLFGGEPDKVSGPQHWVHLQATGASFR